MLTCINLGALTLSEIRSQIRRYLNDVSTDTSKQRWSDTELNFLINQAQKEICDTVWCLYKSSTIYTVANSTYYALPNDLYVIYRVTIDNEVLPEKTIKALDAEDAYWMKASAGKPEYYYITLDKARIGLYPTPDKQYKLKIDYVRIPSDLTNDSDVPFDNVKKYYPYHYLLIYYVVGHCWLEEGKTAQARDMFQLYAIGLQKMANQIKVSPNFIPHLGVRRE